MAVVSADGEAKPFDADGQSYAFFGQRVPVLRSFYLAYDIADSTPNDHELLSIGVMVGGTSTDLSPNVNFQPANIPDGRLEVALQDESPAGEVFSYKVSHSTLAMPAARRFQIRQVGNVKEVIRTLPAEIFGNRPELGEPLLALVGFRLFFNLGRDHELQRIGIWFRGHDLHVVFEDANPNPPFDYSFLVDFVVIPPRPDIWVFRGVESGTAIGGGRVPVPLQSRAHLLLTGWSLNFENGEHRIREIGVDRQGENFVPLYADENADDPISWRIEWAQIAPQGAAPPLA